MPFPRHFSSSQESTAEGGSLFGRLNIENLSIMRLSFSFLLSGFLVCSSPLAVPEELKNSEAFKSSEVLSARDDNDSPKAFTTALSLSSVPAGQPLFDQPFTDQLQPLSPYNQPLNTIPAGLPDFVPTLHAQSIVDEVSNKAAAAGALGIGAILDILRGAIDNFNIYPSTPAANDEGTKPLGLKKEGETPSQAGTVRAGTVTRQGGTGENDRDIATDEGGGCGGSKFGNRRLVWCDVGDPRTAILEIDNTITVFGVPCELCPHYVPSHILPIPPNKTFSLLFYILMNVAHLDTT